MKPRPSARLLVVDPEDRVLLLRFNHREGPLAGQVYWATPGGALEPGESWEAAALRELAEETGILAADPGAPVHARDFPLQMPDGSWVEAQERFYLIRVPVAEVDTAHRTAHEAEVLDRHRWWPVLELARTTDIVHPCNLPDILRPHLMSAVARRLRPYDPDRDLEHCMSLWRAASEVGHPFLDATTLDADAAVIRDQYMPAAEITVAERDGAVIGFIALLGELVGGLFVDPAAHRSGAGRALIEDALRRKGRLEVEVFAANSSARAFYTACGFAETGRRDTDDHGRELPLIRMTLQQEEPQMTQLTALSGAEWLNQPPVWHLRAEELTLETGERTDFWRDTLYGFRRDSGHALLVPAEGDFTAHVGFEGAYEALYDQAGLMLRQDEGHWIKAGIELSDGVANLSVVVTRGASDWSTLALGPTPGPQRLRLTRLGGAVVIQARNDANRWQLLRVTPFPEGPLRIGPMACSPERGGFRARFTEFTFGPAVAQALHDEGPAT